MPSEIILYSNITRIVCGIRSKEEIWTAKQLLILKKIDEVLKVTESFVNATNQLKAVKQSLDKYISSVGAIDSKLADITTKAPDCVRYASSFFNGDFTKEIVKLMGDVISPLYSF